MDTDWMGGRGRRKKDLQGEKRLEKEIEKSLNVKFLFKKKKKKRRFSRLSFCILFKQFIIIIIIFKTHRQTVLHLLHHHMQLEFEACERTSRQKF